jgi:hypothetical protein
MAADKMHSDPRESLTQAQLEQIAALVDNRLAGHERDDAMRLLADSEEAYAVYAETVALVRGTGQDDHPASEPMQPARPAGGQTATPTPASGLTSGAGGAAVPWYAIPWKSAGDLVAAARTTTAWKTAVPLLAAAGIAVLLLLPGASFDASELTNSLGPQVLVLGLDSDHPVSASRGPAVAASDGGRAYRLGVRVMDAQGQIRVDRRTDARVTIELALGLLDDLGAPSPVILPFRDVRDGSGDLEEADSSVETWLGPTPTQLARYRFGKSSEAVRFATVAGERDLVVGAIRGGYFDPAQESGLTPDVLDSLDAFSELAASSDFNPTEQTRMVSLLEGVMTRAAR